MLWESHPSSHSDLKFCPFYPFSCPPHPGDGQGLNLAPSRLLPPPVHSGASTLLMVLVTSLACQHLCLSSYTVLPENLSEALAFLIRSCQRFFLLRGSVMVLSTTFCPYCLLATITQSRCQNAWLVLCPQSVSTSGTRCLWCRSFPSASCLHRQILLPLKAKPMATTHPKPLLISLAGSNFCLPQAPQNCVYTNKVVIHTDKFAYLIL